MQLQTGYPWLRLPFKANLQSCLLLPSETFCSRRADLFVQVLESEGLNKFLDAGYLQHELSEATGMSQHEMDVAAYELMSGQSRPATQQSGHTDQRHQRHYDGNVR